MAETINIAAFLIFPYLALTLFVVGHAFRYATDWTHWNAKSSQLLDKSSLRYGISIFHWGVIIVFLGHFGGMLIPQALYDVIGFDTHRHELVARWLGLLSGVLMVFGVFWLLVRRTLRGRIFATTSKNDYFLLLFLLLVSGLGLYNLLFAKYDVLFKVAPWIRSILVLAPRPELMAAAPVSFKLHITLALALLAYSPFTRLVHIWSIPVTYVFRRYVVFRRRAGEM